MHTRRADPSVLCPVAAPLPELLLGGLGPGRSPLRRRQPAAGASGGFGQLGSGFGTDSALYKDSMGCTIDMRQGPGGLAIARKAASFAGAKLNPHDERAGP